LTDLPTNFGPTNGGETGATLIRAPRPRRQLMIGAGATASLILTLANRPAFAAKTCNHSTWISWKGELTHPSQEPSPCTGDSPTTWTNNAASLWAPSWGNAYLKTTKFTATFPAVTQNGWSRKSGTDTLLSALQGNIVIQHGAGNNLQTEFPKQATAALLNINFYGDKYGTAANAQTTAALIAAVASALATTDFNTGQNNINNNIVNKYSPLNQA
jgi:hypothetical protein